MTAPTRVTQAGQAYLELRAKARGDRRPVDELLQRAVICEVASLRLDDGVVFDVGGATATMIRDEDAYSGVRVTMKAELATARPHFHIDVNVGDPIVPAPQELRERTVLGASSRILVVSQQPGSGVVVR